jgi:protein phosphatase 2C family protein 2/3
MASISFICGAKPALIHEIAEFRGPGVHHNFDDSDSGFEHEGMDQKGKGFGNQRGRIILLGDGTEVLTDSDDTEMFDHSEEDRDLASQVHKPQVTSTQDTATSEKTGTADPANKSTPASDLPNSTAAVEKKEESEKSK